VSETFVRLRLTTKPNYWVRVGQSRTPVAYQEIVEIYKEYGSLPVDPDKGQSLWRLPNWFGERLHSYWQLRLKGEWGPYDYLRNCMGFACHMAGIAPADVNGHAFHVLDAIFKSDQSQPCDPLAPLPLGAIAILGNPVTGGVCFCGECGSHVVHAWVGLGGSKIIEVKSHGGNLSVGWPSDSFDYRFHTTPVISLRAFWATSELKVRVFYPPHSR